MQGVFLKWYNILRGKNMTNSKVGKSYSNDWKKKLKRLVANKDKQEIFAVLDEVFNEKKINPMQMQLFNHNVNF